jgi:hypothetical protein
MRLSVIFPFTIDEVDLWIFLPATFSEILFQSTNPPAKSRKAFSHIDDVRFSPPLEPLVQSGSNTIAASTKTVALFHCQVVDAEFSSSSSLEKYCHRGHHHQINTRFIRPWKTSTTTRRS